MKRKNSASSDVITGVFVLAVLATLVYFTVVISGVDVVFGRKLVPAQFAFEQVGGLKARDAVTYRGTRVGSVESIELVGSNLLVRVEIDPQATLRSGSYAAVRSLSLLGGCYLEVVEGDGAALGESERTVRTLRGEPPIDWMSDFSKAAKNLNRLTGDTGFSDIVSNLQATTERARIIAERLERGEGLLGKLLSPNDTVYTNLQVTAAYVADVTGRIKRGEGTLGRLVAEDAVYTNLVRTAENATALSDRLRRGEGTFGRLLSPDDHLYEDIQASVAAFRKACEGFAPGGTNGVPAVVAGAQRLVDNLNVVAERMKEGRGTLGRLMADEGMYNEVNGLIRDVRQVIDNYRDTTPISTFSSLATGAL